MKGYINTSNYYLSSLALAIPATDTAGTIEVVDIMCDGVTLPTDGYYWVDVDFNDTDKREIFRITGRQGYTLTYDKRISPNGTYAHAVGAPVGLRDFSELLNSLSKNTDNFGEVEIWSGLNIKIHGGHITSPGRGYKEIGDTIVAIPADSTSYVEYSYSLNTFQVNSEINNDNYLLARITSGQNMIFSIEDMRSVLVNGGGIGDMLKETYDPTGKNADAFFIDNMYETTDGEKKVVSKEEAETWDNKQDFLVSGNNLKTINGHSLLMNDGSGLDNLVIAPTLGFDFAYEVSEYGVATYQITSNNTPVSSSSFMVFVNSGTGMFPITDYTYNSTTRTITLVNQLAENERLIIWIIKKSGTTIDPDDIGRGVITIRKNGATVDTFMVNQTADKTIDIGTVGDGELLITFGGNEVVRFLANQTADKTVELQNYIKDGELTLRQGNNNLGSFSANSSTSKTIQFKDLILVTQTEYDELGPEKVSDGNFYLLYT